MPFCLVGTLQKEFVIILGDAYRIETYHSVQCFFKTQMLEITCDGEILQVVIYEGYIVVLCDGIKVFEYLTERQTFVLSGNSLGCCNAGNHAQ
jgi:hypothetical protein